MKVEISSIDIAIDIEIYSAMWHVCNGGTTLHKIYRDGAYLSHVALGTVAVRTRGPMPG